MSTLIKNLVRGVTVLASITVCVRTAGATGVGESISSMGENVSNVPQLINYAAYIIGAASGVSGLMKLKQFNDSPSQNSLMPAIGRLIAAALFISLPYVLYMSQQTTQSTSGGTVSFTQIPNITSNP